MLTDKSKFKMNGSDRIVFLGGIKRVAPVVYHGDSKTRSCILDGMGAMSAEGIGPVTVLEGRVNGESSFRGLGRTFFHYWQERENTRHNTARHQCMSPPCMKLKLLGIHLSTAVCDRQPHPATTDDLKAVITEEWVKDIKAT